jgi:hypothetical protein
MKYQTILAGLIFSSGFYAQAGIPVVNPKCTATTQIQAVENGAGVYFSDDCKTAYVLPPANGRVSLAGITENANLEQCGAFETALRMVNQSYKMAEDALKAINTPTQKRPAPSSPLGPSTGALGGNRNTSAPAASSENREAALARYQQALATAKDAQALLEPFKDIEGATAQIVFSANWDKVVQAYSNANPGIRFERLQMSNQVFSYLRKTSSDLLKMPAAFSVRVPGVASIIAADGITPSDNANLVFGEALSGQAILTLAGACPLYNSSTHSIRKNITGSELSALFSANVQFEFNLLARRKYQASYNLAQLMKRIQESGSRGGFFSSSSYSSLLIEKNSNDWFTFKSEDEDPRHAYDLDGLRATVKADLISRVAKTIVEMNGGDAYSVPAPGAPGPHGSTVASASLKKCPNLYCQLGAVALDILDATFGSSSTNSTFINSNNYWARDDVDEGKTLPFTGSYTFVGGN